MANIHDKPTSNNQRPAPPPPKLQTPQAVLKPPRCQTIILAGELASTDGPDATRTVSARALFENAAYMIALENAVRAAGIKIVQLPPEEPAAPGALHAVRTAQRVSRNQLAKAVDIPAYKIYNLEHENRGPKPTSAEIDAMFQAITRIAAERKDKR
jgi:DNA-binding XRE family transcriptional regulator